MDKTVDIVCPVDVMTLEILNEIALDGKRVQRARGAYRSNWSSESLYLYTGVVGAY
jgi:hypothetical protein